MNKYFAVIVLVSMFSTQVQAESQPSPEDVKKFLSPEIKSSPDNIEDIDTNTDTRRINYGEISEPGKLEQELTEYVDGRFKNRKSCFHRPARPAWAYEMPREYNRFHTIADEMYQLVKFRAVEEAQNCTCDAVYPEWDEVFAPFQTVISETEPGTSPRDLLRTYRNEVSELRASSNYMSICSATALNALQ